jgi:general secretion pathway protein D
MAAVKGVATKDIEFDPRPPGYEVNFNLEEADLGDLVKAISSITGRRFIYGGKLRAIKATVHAPTKITVGEAYQAFLSILEGNGMTVIQHGRFLKIVETTGIASESTEVLPPSAPVPNEDRYVTRLVRLDHLDAVDAATVLAKFKSKEGDITVHAPGNLLIITETGANIRRMLRLLEEIDVGGSGEHLWVEPIHYAAASELAAKLSEVLDLKPSKGPTATPQAGAGTPTAGRSGGAGVRLVPDERTNAIVIAGTESDYARVFELIKRFDVKNTGDGDIRVFALQHGSCKEISPTLSQILGTASAATAAARPGTPPGAPPGANRTPGAAGAGISDVFEGQIRMTCDESTNSVITTSSLRDYATVRSVIEKLDRPRRQVFIEATIMDVSIDRSTELGVSYHFGSPVGFGSAGSGLVYGGNNISQSVSGVPSNLEGLALGIRGPDIPGSQNIFGTGVSIPALGAVLSAMAKDGDANVLATPHILATDNVKAEISIGQNIPLQTNVSSVGSLGALAGQSGAGALGALSGLGTTTPRQDVGTKISVTPHLNDSNQVRLELDEEISEAGAPQGSLGAVPINKRTATTTLVVRDQQTVVIGGLVRDAATNAETKIPILGDIPLLGFLFKQSSKTKQKSNLLLILTPYIIRDQDDLRAIFERKMQERQEIIDRYFVFGNAPWTPPHDYRKANGLLEDIRQSLLAQDERRRVIEQSAPPARKTHTPSEPVVRSIGGRHVRADALAEVPEVRPAAPPVGGASATPARPARRRETRPPAVDRIE